MPQEFQTVSRPSSPQSAKTPRRRILEQEAPVLAAIAVLLCAWLVLALGG